MSDKPILNPANVGSIYVKNGLLIVDFTSFSKSNKHYNISYHELDGCITVTGELAYYDASLTKGDFDLSVITESSIEEYKPWPWSLVKKRSKQVVEYLERKERFYKSNHYLIISGSLNARTSS